MRKLLFCLCVLLHAAIFGRIQGIVHDPQHRPLAGALVTLKAITSDWSQTTQTDDNGEFLFTSVPVGDYKITVAETNQFIRHVERRNHRDAVETHDLAAIA
ncbi:MAG: carboxypeptidase-like regulatory domain-containing protein, partial [Bryobacteraceae bacterium]